MKRRGEYVCVQTVARDRKKKPRTRAIDTTETEQALRVATQALRDAEFKLKHAVVDVAAARTFQSQVDAKARVTVLQELVDDARREFLSVEYRLGELLSEKLDQERRAASATTAAE